jgi:hypothetical protein
LSLGSLSLGSLSLGALSLGALSLGCSTTTFGPEAEPPSTIDPSEATVAEYYNPQGNPLQDLLAAENERRTQGFSAQSNWVSGLWHAELGAFTLAATVYSPLSGSSYGQEPNEGQCDAVADAPDAVEAFCAQLAEVEPGLEQRDPEAGPPQWVFVEHQPNLPATRVFGRQVLECAREAGFTHVAIEALQEEGADVTARGHVTRSSGVLAREPQLARLVERAVELGYEIVNYDVPGRAIGNEYFTDVERYAERQADNLLAKTYDQDADAKVLVFTLPYEARKQIWRQQVTRRTSVATLVRQRTGIEPYAVDARCFVIVKGVFDPLIVQPCARLLHGVAILDAVERSHLLIPITVSYPFVLSLSKHS